VFTVFVDGLALTPQFNRLTTVPTFPSDTLTIVPTPWGGDMANP